MNLTQKDLLIHRLLEGSDSSADWNEIELLASNDPNLWKELGTALRDQNELQSVVSDSVAKADAIELPFDQTHQQGTWSKRLQKWSGWAAACLLAVILWTESRTHFGTGGGHNLASPVPVRLSPAEALDQYRESDRFVRDLPNRVVHSQPAADGDGLEVIYVRQIMEKALVREAYDFHPNDRGAVVPVRTSPVWRPTLPGF